MILIYLNAECPFLLQPSVESSTQLPLFAQKMVFKLAGTPLEPKSILGKVTVWQPRAHNMESFGISSGSSKEKGLVNCTLARYGMEKRHAYTCLKG